MAKLSLETPFDLLRDLPGDDHRGSLPHSSHRAQNMDRRKRGHELTAARSRELAAREGPRPAQAVAEALSAVPSRRWGMWLAPRESGQ